MRQQDNPIAYRIHLAAVFLLLMMMVTLASADTQVTLQWDPNSGDATIGYRLFCRQGNQPYDYQAPVYDGADNQCTVNQLTENTTYYFVVRAYDSSNNMSGDSNEVRFIYDSNPPETPLLLNPENNATAIPREPFFATDAFTDPDASDYHVRTQWQGFRSADNLCIFDLSSNEFLTDFQLPPLILDGGTTYSWTARHYNQNGAGSQPAPNAFFTTAPVDDDGNANGVPDIQEVPCTSVLPGSAPAELKCFTAADENVHVGLSVAGNGPDVSLVAAQSVYADQVQADPTTHAALPIGLINYKLNIGQVGAAVSLTIYLSNPIPSHNDWLVYDISGYAPAKSFIYASDRKSVTLQLYDGGDGDMDGVANGIIVGLSGYGTESDGTSTNLSGSSSGGGGGGAGCFIKALSER